MTGLFTLLLIIAGVVACGPAPAQSSGKPSEQRAAAARKLEDKVAGIAFFVAKGEPNSCGEGCDNWIAADGIFDRAAAERFREFLKEPTRSKLPVYFYSPGGSLLPAMEIGRLLRRQKMTAGVAKTNPLACDQSKAGEKTCEALKRSGKELPAELRTIDGACGSACVYALIGAAVRQIAPDAILAVHSTKISMLRSDGSIVSASAAVIQQANARTRSYITEMGIDAALFEVALGTPHERFRPLTRDEIARFRIDARPVVESRWQTKLSSEFAMIEKSFSEQEDRQSYKHRSSFLRLTCAESRDIRIEYVRVLSALEADTASSIKFATHQNAVDFPVKVSQGEVLPNQTRTMNVSAKFLEAATLGEPIIITETFLPKNAESWSRVTKLSTGGLSTSLRWLMRYCR